MNTKVKNVDSTRYDGHYQKLLNAVKNKYFYTAIHEAQECIIYGKRDETGRFK